MKNKSYAYVLSGLCILFVLIRLPGIDLPYHQDEWKNISAASSAEQAGSFFAHPPLQQIFFVVSHQIFGEDGMRLPFILFGLAAAVMLYLVVRERTSKRAGAPEEMSGGAAGSVALWATFLFVICFYNILGSLMTDVDGGILPFLFLLAVYAYDKFCSRKDPVRWRWFALLIAALLAGLLIKLNFILVVDAIALDFIWKHRREINLRNVGIFIGSLSAFIVGYIFLLFTIQGIYSPFSIDFMLKHANQFSEDAGRNYIQIVVQGMKALYYMSPIALLVFWMNRSIFKKTLVFWIYLVCGFIFYFIAFDFSRGALDKYLMYIIVPLCVVGGFVLADVFRGMGIGKGEGNGWNRMGDWFKKNLPACIVALVTVIILIAINFLPHIVVPLYPKTAWFARVLHGHWDVLTPFNGGSGPMGFYVSFMMIGVSYIISILCIIAGLVRKSWRTGAALVLLAVVLTYNGVFTEEYVNGRINGSASDVLAESVEFISLHPEIKEVLTFNDTGAQKLERAGVYAGRFYAAPQFEEGHKVKFAEYTGAYLVVGIPPLYDGFYSDFLSKCDTLFTTQSGMIVGKIYTCRQPNP